jgi:hypothetical protein
MVTKKAMRIFKETEIRVYRDVMNGLFYDITWWEHRETVRSATLDDLLILVENYEKSAASMLRHCRKEDTELIAHNCCKLEVARRLRATVGATRRDLMTR